MQALEESGDPLNMAKKPDIKYIDYLQDKYGLSDAQREILHEEITGQNLSKQEIEQIAIDIKTSYPNK